MNSKDALFIVRYGGHQANVFAAYEKGLTGAD